MHFLHLLISFPICIFGIGPFLQLYFFFPDFLPWDWTFQFSISCYSRSRVCGQIFFYLTRHTNKANESVQSRIDWPFHLVCMLNCWSINSLSLRICPIQDLPLTLVSLTLKNISTILLVPPHLPNYSENAWPTDQCNKLNLQ